MLTTCGTKRYSREGKQAFDYIFKTSKAEAKTIHQHEAPVQRGKYVQLFTTAEGWTPPVSEFPQRMRGHTSAVCPYSRPPLSL